MAIQNLKGQERKKGVFKLFGNCLDAEPDSKWQQDPSREESGNEHVCVHDCSCGRR